MYDPMISAASEVALEDQSSEKQVAMILQPPKTLGELFSEVLTVYSSRFSTLLTVTALVYLPFFIQMVFVLVVGAMTGSAGGFQVVEMVSNLLQVPLMMIIGVLVVPLVAHIVLEHRQDRVPTPSDCFAFLKRRIAPLALTFLVTSFLIFFGTLAGTILLILPGLAFFLWSIFAWSLAYPVAVIEEHSGYPALQRSWELVKQDPGYALGTMVVCLGGLMTIGFIGTIGFMTLGVASGATLGTGLMGNVFRFGITELFYLFSGILVAPLYPIVMTLLYLDLRARQEFTGLPGKAAPTQDDLTGDLPRIHP